MVALVHLEVIGEVVDFLGEKRDLDLGRARVPVVELEFSDDPLLLFLGERHSAHLLPGSGAWPRRRVKPSRGAAIDVSSAPSSRRLGNVTSARVPSNAIRGIPRHWKRPSLRRARA